MTRKKGREEFYTNIQKLTFLIRIFLVKSIRQLAVAKQKVKAFSRDSIISVMLWKKAECICLTDAFCHQEREKICLKDKFL